MTLAAEPIESIEALARLREPWDALAVAAGRPYCAPGWMLAWWEHQRPEGAQLRAVAVRDGDRLVGIAPLWVADGGYALLAGDLSSNVEPLVEPGREREAAAAFASVLADADPRPNTVAFNLQSDVPDWSELLSTGWPGGRRRPWTAVTRRKDVLVVTVEELDFETWLKGKSSKFRYWVRQGRRKLEAAGAEFRLATEETLERDVAELLRLHHARHAEGGSDLASDGGLERMLVAAGRELIPSGRFRLICVDIDGRVASAQLMLAAGGEVGGWNSGFDEAYAKLSPATHAVVHGLGLAMERGDRHVDLGPGDQAYKRRLADGERTLASRIVVPPGPKYVPARLAIAWGNAPAAIGRRLPPGARDRLRRALGRDPGGQ